MSSGSKCFSIIHLMIGNIIDNIVNINNHGCNLRVDSEQACRCVQEIRKMHNETREKIGSPPSPTSQKLLFVVEAVSLSGGNFQFVVLDDFLQSSIQILLLLL